MKEKIKSNNGFTLIELVIAIAMLAFVMAAVSALMGSSVLNFRKSKANIAVQNMAQSTYDQISDSIMQAQRIVILGFEGSADVDFKDAKTKDSTGGTFNEYCYVANEEIKAEYTTAGYNVKLFSEISANTKIYVNKLIIDVSTPFIPAASDTGDTITKHNNLTGQDVTIKNYTEYKKQAEDASGNPMVDASGNPIMVDVHDDYKDAEGNKIYDANDTIRYTYTFSDTKIYCEKEYAFNTAENYVIDWGNSDSVMYGEYCGNLKYLVSSTNQSVEGCVITVDALNGAIGLELHFDDKDMTYDTTGLVKVRNSNVLENN